MAEIGLDIAVDATKAQRGAVVAARALGQVSEAAERVGRESNRAAFALENASDEMLRADREALNASASVDRLGTELAETSRSARTAAAGIDLSARKSGELGEAFKRASSPIEFTKKSLESLSGIPVAFAITGLTTGVIALAKVFTETTSEASAFAESLEQITKASEALVEAQRDLANQIGSGAFGEAGGTLGRIRGIASDQVAERFGNIQRGSGPRNIGADFFQRTQESLDLASGAPSNLLREALDAQRQQILGFLDEAVAEIGNPADIRGIGASFTRRVREAGISPEELFQFDSSQGRQFNNQIGAARGFLTGEAFTAPGVNPARQLANARRLLGEVPLSAVSPVIGQQVLRENFTAAERALAFRGGPGESGVAFGPGLSESIDSNTGAVEELAIVLANATASADFVGPSPGGFAPGPFRPVAGTGPLAGPDTAAFFAEQARQQAVADEEAAIFLRNATQPSSFIGPILSDSKDAGEEISLNLIDPLQSGLQNMVSSVLLGAQDASSAWEAFARSVVASLGGQGISAGVNALFAGINAGAGNTSKKQALRQPGTS